MWDAALEGMPSRNFIKIALGCEGTRSPLMQRRFFFSLALFLALGGAWLNPAGVSAEVKPLVIKEKDSGKTFTVRVGQRLVVDLRLKGGQQVVAPEFNPQILALVGQSLQSSLGAKGAMARVVYQFVVRQGGQTDLVVAVKRSEEQPGKPKELLKVKIVASGGGKMI